MTATPAGYQPGCTRTSLTVANGILVGSLPGVVIGTGLVRNVPVAARRQGLGVILIAAALGVLTKARIAVPPAAIVAIPTMTTALLVIVHQRRKRSTWRLPPDEVTPRSGAPA